MALPFPNPNVQAAVASKTVWSDVATIGVGLLGFAAAHALIPPAFAKDAQALVFPAVTVVAGAVGLWGRWRVDIPTLSGWWKVNVQTPAGAAALTRDVMTKVLASRELQALVGMVTSGSPPPSPPPPPPPPPVEDPALESAMGKLAVHPKEPAK